MKQKTMTGIVLMFMFLIPQVLSGKIDTKKWVEDLDYLVSALTLKHPHLFYRVSEKTFNQVVERSREEIRNAGTDLAAYFALKKVVAAIRDGHTQLWGILGIEKVRFPFRLDRFSDGVFITVIRADHQRYLGSRVTAVNRMPVETVLDLIESVTNMDTAFGKIRPSVQDITFARNLKGLGIIDSEKSVQLDLVTPEGRKEEVTFESFVDDEPVRWSNRITMAPAGGRYISPADLLGDSTPLHMKKQGANIEFYWFEHLKKEKAVYFQYNQVSDQRGHHETWAAFTGRFWRYMDDHRDDIEKLIIDIRYNDGGNGRTMIPFINQVIKRDQFRDNRSLFVITGNRTYSAAVILMTELAVHTDAVFVGTPPACPFNFFSDMEMAPKLPNCGASLGIASRQIDNAWSPQTVYFQPDIPAPFSSTDYFSGKDPAMEIILKGDVRSIADIAADDGVDAAMKHYRMLKKKFGHITWWKKLAAESLENDVNNRGYDYLNARKVKKSQTVFRLNTILFPDSFNVWDSYAESFMVAEDYDNALTYYQKSMELNPKNRNGERMITHINEILKKRK